MDNKDINEPKLIFFRDKPNDLLTRPPLASSLQHLETSFLLITLSRYPHALVSCASAVESALKAAFSVGQKKPLNFESLLKRANEKFSPNAVFNQNDLDEFRRKRNEIVHYGFSPKDDEICAILLLKTGYRLIEHCYESFFNFPLKRKGEAYGGLRPDIDCQLDIATRVYLKAKNLKDLNLTYCFIAFTHEIRWGIQHWMLSDWQREILASENSGGDLAWEYKHKQKESLSSKDLDPAWHFNCPICGEIDSFVCELDDEELDRSRIALKRGVCVNCSLLIPMNCPFLLDELCVDQFENAHAKIMNEYGIA
jgi:transcription elongation factor Elf1